ncbi:MAG: ABC transporter substrate-binding protein [Deltaproteobacteria bacterium]|nr:ABC transporter substrate-binding protein [Deltaproteobacteria bacterium]
MPRSAEIEGYSKLRKFSSAGLLPTFLVLLVSVAFGQSAPQPARLKVAYSTVAVGQSLAWVTKESGIFAQNQLDVELVFIGSSTVVTQALIAGNIPIAIMSGVAAINANLSGGDLIIVGSTKNEPVLSFLVTSKDISDTAQLKGRRLGVSRLGASSDFLLRYLLKRVGLVPEKDVAIVQVGSSPMRVAALAKGVIDGTALEIEEVMVARRLGFNVLIDISKLGIEALNSDVITTRKFILQSRETVRNFIKGIVDGVAFYKNNKAFSMEVISRYTKSTDKEKIELGYDHNARIYLKKPYPTVKGIQLALEEIRDRNPAAAGAGYQQFMDNSIVRELDESGYIDRLFK